MTNSSYLEFCEIPLPAKLTSPFASHYFPSLRPLEKSADTSRKTRTLHDRNISRSQHWHMRIINSLITLGYVDFHISNIKDISIKLERLLIMAFWIIFASASASLSGKSFCEWNTARNIKFELMNVRSEKSRLLLLMGARVFHRHERYSAAERRCEHPWKSRCNFPRMEKLSHREMNGWGASSVHSGLITTWKTAVDIESDSICTAWQNGKVLDDTTTWEITEN